MTQQLSKDQIAEYLISNIIDHLVGYLIDDKSMSLSEALDVVYRSVTIKRLQSREGELYTQSPAYVYELLRQELEL